MKQRLRNILYLVLVVAMLVSVFAGCGSDKSDTPSTSQTTDAN